MGAPSLRRTLSGSAPEDALAGRPGASVRKGYASSWEGAHEVRRE